MKTILYVVSHYYPYIGGVEYVVKSVAERLVKIKGYEVTVLAGSPHQDHPVTENINNVEVIRWPTFSPADAYHFPRKRDEFKKVLGKLVSNADIVHVHSAHSILSVMSGLLAKKLGSSVKLIASLHYHGGGHGLIRKILWKTIWRRYVRELIDSVNLVHTVSHVEANLVLRHFNNARDKLVVIPNGVEEDVLNYRWEGEDGDYVVYAGRIEKYKRLDEAVKIIPVISKKLRQKLRLIIVGKGPYLKKLRRVASHHHNIELVDHLPRKEYLSLLSKARFAINLSTHEAFSIFTAEALMIGVPVIASKHIASIFARLTNVKIIVDEELRRIVNDAVLLKKTNNTRIHTWTSIVNEYVSKLYS